MISKIHVGKDDTIRESLKASDCGPLNANKMSDNVKNVSNNACSSNCNSRVVLPITPVTIRALMVVV